MDTFPPPPLLNQAVYCENVRGSESKIMCIINPLFAINYHYFLRHLIVKSATIV